MMLAVCKQTPEGYKVVKTLVAGKAMRTHQDFVDCVGFIRPDEVADLADPKADAIKFVEETRKMLDNLKNETLEHIAAVIRRHGEDVIYAVDIDEGSSPIVIDDEYDGNLTYTLDSIRIKKKKEETYIEIQASNCCNTILLDAKKLDIELLFGIFSWLVENEESLEEDE